MLIVFKILLWPWVEDQTSNISKCLILNRVSHTVNSHILPIFVHHLYPFWLHLRFMYYSMCNILVFHLPKLKWCNLDCFYYNAPLFTFYSNMTSFKRFESKPAVKIILIYDRLNLWRHRQFIKIFYQFLHIRIEIIHGSHMYILFLPRVGLSVSFLPFANARGKTLWHKGLPVVKAIYTYGFRELFLKYIQHIFAFRANNSDRMCKWIFKVVVFICWIIQVERSLQLSPP